MEREHMRVHEENKTEAGKVQWVWPDGPDDVGGPVGRRWGRPDEDGDGRMKMGTAGRRWVRTLTGGQVAWMGAREDGTHWGESVGANAHGRVGNVGGGGLCMGSCCCVGPCRWGTSGWPEGMGVGHEL